MIRIQRVGEKTYLYDWNPEEGIWVQRDIVIVGNFDMELHLDD